MEMSLFLYNKMERSSNEPKSEESYSSNQDTLTSLKEI